MVTPWRPARWSQSKASRVRLPRPAAVLQGPQGQRGHTPSEHFRRTRPPWLLRRVSPQPGQDPEPTTCARNAHRQGRTACPCILTWGNVLRFQWGN